VAGVAAVTWPEAFHDVGIAFAVAAGIIGFYWAITR
jgi:hypothetical protein